MEPKSNSGRGGAGRGQGRKPKAKITKDLSRNTAREVLAEVDKSERPIKVRWQEFLNGDPDRALRTLIYLTDRDEGKPVQPTIQDTGPLEKLAEKIQQARQRVKQSG